MQSITAVTRASLNLADSGRGENRIVAAYRLHDGRFVAVPTAGVRANRPYRIFIFGLVSAKGAACHSDGVPRLDVSLL